ncbi:MAG: class I SAM-dependent methyltransferase [Chloroflexi bacterium]|nr:class I SAM-dependent methyltransferase [Chloroflexota bacterium]
MDSNPRVNLVERFFSGTGTTYDRIATLFTGGIDKLWKRRILDQLPSHPKLVVDLASGTGIVTFAIARRYPDAKVIGVELRSEYMEIARVRVLREKIDNVEFILSRAEDVQLQYPADAITSSYLAKYVNWDHLARNMYKMLEPGGTVVIHEFTYPASPVIRWAWEFYLFLLRVIGSRLFPQWRTIFHELPGLIRRTAWVEDALTALKTEGFVDIHFESLTVGAAGIITARKASAA